MFESVPNAFVFCAALLAAPLLRAQPPVEPGPFQPPDLVELVKLDRTIKLDIRYATKNNFLGRRSTSRRVLSCSARPLRRWCA